MSLFARLLSACALVALPVAVASAQVNFTTIGMFTGGGAAGTSTGLFGALLIDFAPVANGTASPNPFTFASFGELRVTAASPTPALVSGNFTLRIAQGAPTGGVSTTLVGTLAGSLSANSSQATLTFGATTVTVGGVTYSLAQTTYALVPPTTNNGVTSLQGRIDLASTTTPEPSTYALFATGIVGLAGMAARRRRRATV